MKSGMMMIISVGRVRHSTLLTVKAATAAVPPQEILDF